MILMIDNYDSFTYNLVQYLQELGAEVRVFRNDSVSVEDLLKIGFSRVVISPGPGNPSSAGISCDVIKEFYQKVPVLGVCLGHQCIGAVFGAKIIQAPEIMHGKTSLIKHDNKAIFKNVKNPFFATRYHSLVIDRKTMPDNLLINAATENGIIMGVRDKRRPLFGVQFHPESILTEAGKNILKNFLSAK